MNYRRGLQIVTGYMAIYHLILGISGVFASIQLIEQLITLTYGATLTVDGTLFYVVKLVAVYFIAFGCMLGAITLNPSKYKPLVWIAVLFLVVRLAELVYFYNFIGQYFQVPDGRLVEKIVVFIVLGSALVFFSSKMPRSSATE